MDSDPDLQERALKRRKERIKQKIKQDHICIVVCAIVFMGLLAGGIALLHLYVF